MDFVASRLITPPNAGGCGGRYRPSIVVVASGEPGVPVIVCAWAATLQSPDAIRYEKSSLREFMGIDATTRIVGVFVSAIGVGLIFDGVIEALEMHGLKSLH